MWFWSYCCAFRGSQGLLCGVKPKGRKFFPTEVQESRIHCTEKCGDPKWNLVLPRFLGHSSSGMTGNANSDMIRHRDVPGWRWLQFHSVLPLFHEHQIPTNKQAGVRDGALAHLSKTTLFLQIFPSLLHHVLPNPNKSIFLCPQIFLFLMTHPKNTPA